MLLEKEACLGVGTAKIKGNWKAACEKERLCFKVVRESEHQILLASSKVLPLPKAVLPC